MNKIFNEKNTTTSVCTFVLVGSLLCIAKVLSLTVVPEAVAMLYIKPLSLMFISVAVISLTLMTGEFVIELEESHRRYKSK